MAPLKKAYQRDYVKILSVFLLFFIVFSLVYLSINRLTSQDDQFFNIRFAQIVKENGLGTFNEFHWLYFSKISQSSQGYFSNPLFYLFLILFTFFNPLILGIKFCAIFFASLLFTVFYGFLLKLKEKYAFIWTLLFFSVTSQFFVWKMLMARAFVIAPAILILLLYFSCRKKYLFVFSISFLYFFWHTATFFFPLLIVGTYFLFENFYGKKPDWKLIAGSFLGTAAAIVLSAVLIPKGFANFVYNLQIVFGIFRDTIIGKSVSIAEGQELYASNFFDVMKSSSLTIILLIIAVFFEVYNYYSAKKSGKNLLAEGKDTEKMPIRGALFFLTLLFFLGMFITGRFTDFFVFFVIIYAALALNPIFQTVRIISPIARKAVAYGFLTALFYLFIANGLFLQDLIASAAPYDQLEGTAEWLAKNTRQNEVVFNATWNWFPALFYYDSRNYYVAGSEPRLLYDYNPEMYWAWWHVSNEGFLCLAENCDSIKAEQGRDLKNDDMKKVWYDNEGNAIADYIKNRFQSQYIVTSITFKKFNDVMDNSGRFEKVYTDSLYNNFFVYKIN